MSQRRSYSLWNQPMQSLRASCIAPEMGKVFTTPYPSSSSYSSSLHTSTSTMEEGKKEGEAGPAPAGRPWSDYTIGVPKEGVQGEKRVAITPENVGKMTKMGFKVVIEKGAGEGSSFSDEMYKNAGAEIVDKKTAFAQDLVMKVRPPTVEEAKGMKENSRLISFLYPDQNKEVVDVLKQKKATAWAMELIPRISRAQSFDALSSMANIAGYKAVLEATNHFGRHMTGQITAAGKLPPAKVLVIGGGVAGE